MIRPHTLAIFLSLFALPLSGLGQDLEPRSYTNLPVAQNFIGLGYAYSDGELNPAPGVPIENADLKIDGSVIAYVRSLDLWGKAGKFDMLWSNLCYEGSAIFQGEPVRADRCGAGDPKFRLSYMFYGAPAMDLKEFSRTPAGFVAGVSIKVSAPWGEYDGDFLLNGGANRWTVKPEIGMSSRWGQWSADAAFATTFYEDNDDFFSDVELEQDPLYQVQSHLIYHLKRGRWLSVNANYFWGGRTHKNGIKGDDVQENSRVGITVAWPLNTQHSLRFYASRGIVTTIGNDSDTVGMVRQYRWGKQG